MKLFNAIAAAALFGASFIGASSVESKEVYSMAEWAECMQGGDSSCVLSNWEESRGRSHLGSESPTSSSNSCPEGTRNYRTKGLFGLGARDLGCMTAYEAESLRRQNYQNFQNNLNRNRMRNCTTNFIGSTAYTNCY